MQLSLTEREMYVLGVLVNRAKDQYSENWVLQELWNKIQLENLNKHGDRVKYGRRESDIIEALEGCVGDKKVSDKSVGLSDSNDEKNK